MKSQKKIWKIWNSKKAPKKSKFWKKSLSIFCSFFLDLSFWLNDISCRIQKFKTWKKHLKNQNFEKSHFALFASFFFIYIFCIMIKAVKCMKKNFKNLKLKKTPKNSKFRKKSLCIFCSFFFDLSIPTIHRKSEKMAILRTAGLGREPGGRGVPNCQ